MEPSTPNAEPTVDSRGDQLLEMVTSVLSALSEARRTERVGCYGEPLRSRTERDVADDDGDA